MAGFNSGQLIEHIEEAKDWLDKAKTEYSNENPVRGNLILNLAQAEVKHAWELSHNQFVSKNNQGVRPVRKPNFFIPVAAVFVLFITIVIGVSIGRQWVTPSEITKVNSPPIIKNEVTPLTGGEENKVVVINPQPGLNQEVDKTLEPKADITENPSTLVAKNRVPEVKSSNPSRMNSSKQIDQDVAPNKSILKPVTQLNIDEDALTNEASHSLRNGK